MFTTANLYAIWSIGPQAAQLNYLLPILESNIFENSILLSVIACKYYWYFLSSLTQSAERLDLVSSYRARNTTFFDIFIASAQYAALKTGAEMGKLSMDKSKQEKQAGDAVNKMFAVLIGMSVPLQIYFNVPGKIFESPKNSSLRNIFLKICRWPVSNPRVIRPGAVRYHLHQNGIGKYR